MKTVILSAVLGSALLVGCAKDKVIVKPDGTTETLIKLEEVPQAVTFAFNKDFPRIAPTKIYKEVYTDGTVHYEFKWIDTAGKEVEVEYNTTGEKLDD